MIETILPILKSLALGAFFGGEAALIGFLKNEELPTSWKIILSKDFWNTFDVVKALKTVLVGMLMGVFTQGQMYMPQITEALNVNPSDPTLLVVIATVPSLIVYTVDQLIKLIVRRTPLVKLWDKLKVFALKSLQKQEEIVAKAKTLSEITKTPSDKTPQ